MCREDGGPDQDIPDIWILLAPPALPLIGLCAHPCHPVTFQTPQSVLHSVPATLSSCSLNPVTSAPGLRLGQAAPFLCSASGHGQRGRHRDSPEALLTRRRLPAARERFDQLHFGPSVSGRTTVAVLGMLAAYHTPQINHTLSAG